MRGVSDGSCVNFLGVLSLICGHAPQSEISLEDRECLYDEFRNEWDMYVCM